MATTGNTSTTSCTMKIFQRGNPPENTETLYIKIKILPPGPAVEDVNCPDWSKQGNRTIEEALPTSASFPDRNGINCNTEARHYCRSNATFDTDECSLIIIKPYRTGLQESVKFECLSGETTTFTTVTEASTTNFNRSFQGAGSTKRHQLSVLPGETTTSMTVTETSTTNFSEGNTTHGYGDGNLANDFPYWIIILAVVIVLILLASVTAWLIIRRRRMASEESKGDGQPDTTLSVNYHTDEEQLQVQHETKSNPLYETRNDVNPTAQSSSEQEDATVTSQKISPYAAAEDSFQTDSDALSDAFGRIVTPQRSNPIIARAEEEAPDKTSQNLALSEPEVTYKMASDVTSRNLSLYSAAVDCHQMASEVTKQQRSTQGGNNYEIIQDGFAAGLEPNPHSTPQQKPTQGGHSYEIIQDGFVQRNPNSIGTGHAVDESENIYHVIKESKDVSHVVDNDHVTSGQPQPSGSRESDTSQRVTVDNVLYNMQC